MKPCTEKKYIYIYIFLSFYPFLKYCTDGPMVIINYRNMKLFLNEGSCVLTDSKQYVFKHYTNTMGSTPFSFTLCIQCAEYIDRNRVHTGMITMHHTVAEHFLYICFLGLLASVTDGSWPCVVG